MNQISTYFLTRNSEAPILNGEYRTVLNSEEIKRFQDYENNKKAIDFANKRIFLKKCLSKRIGLPIQNINVLSDEFGRPYLSDHKLDFNLSDDNGLTVLAISDVPKVGIDWISIHRANKFLPVAHRFFHPEEYSFLSQLEDTQCKIEFLKLWSLKEAALKALGKGIAAGLNNISFQFYPQFKVHNDLNDYKFLFFLASINQGYLAVAHMTEQNCDSQLIFKPNALAQIIHSDFELRTPL